ncbi:uncharacterized protein LOC142750481 [Rhinoderma darwinii]|uniref:uncharacterized protein LOC142750481 n=1 Tax=Rhinoderma darwinii TaxID=43563 RepID=UPI003F6729A6
MTGYLCCCFGWGRLFLQGCTVAKVNRFMAAIAFGLKLRGLVDVTKHFLVSQVLRGLRKGVVVRDRRRPVSFQLLCELGEVVWQVCKSPSESKLFRLAFSLAFFGAFQVGELVSPSASTPGGVRQDDVDVYEDRVEIVLRYSKTDQMGRGRRLVLFALPGNAVCPVSCLREFSAGAVISDSPLLRHSDGTFLSRFQFVAVFRKCLVACQVRAEQYSSHSFRIGAVTEAVRWGLDDAGVQRIGRWKSARFRSYVRPHML